MSKESVDIDSLSNEALENAPGPGLYTPIEEVAHPEEDEQLPITPTIDTRQRELEEKEVAYYTKYRGPEDVVLSGPIIGGWGPGQYFQNRARAQQFLKDKYGPERVKELEGKTRGRWAFLVKGLRNAT